MNKKIYIKGMTCRHCQMRVNNALSNMKGIEEVKVNLEEGYADIKDTIGYENQIFIDVIDDAGYDVTKIG